MEQLQELLIAYNNKIPFGDRYTWSEQYLSSEFPYYWQVVYSQLSKLDKSMRVLEIGAGQGDITAICCYLGFRNITAFERNPKDFSIAQEKLSSLFGRNDILTNGYFQNEKIASDILIIVNCAYAEGSHNKDQYISILEGYYKAACNPSIFILEVIDTSYTIPDIEFPEWIRLSKEDIRSLFPNAKITEIETYKYPTNKRSKTLYIIKHNL